MTTTPSITGGIGGFCVGSAGVHFVTENSAHLNIGLLLTLAVLATSFPSPFLTRQSLEKKRNLV